MADYLKDLISRVKKKKEGSPEGGEAEIAESAAPRPGEMLQKKAVIPPRAAAYPAPRAAMPRAADTAGMKNDILRQMKSAVSAPKVKVPEPQPEEDEEETVEGAEEEMPEPAAEAEAYVPEESGISTVEQELEGAKKTEIASYGNTKIYRVAGEPLLYYWTPVPRARGAEKSIINTLKEAATRLISITPYKIRDLKERENVYYQKVMEIMRESTEMQIPKGKMEFYAQAVVREMVGYGLIDPLIKDDKLEEIMVIGPNKPVYVFHREYEMMKSNIEFYSEKEVQDLINRIARQVGRRVDMSSPLLDARLPDGSRVNATMPPASVSGSSLTIRKFREDPYSIVDLINMGTVNTEVAAFLWLAVEGLGVKPANILISGGTGSGKTTTLNVLAAFIPANERIVSIEDTAELNLPMKHWIRLEARPPGLEGTGELTLDILTKNSLRMRPDRVIVGEVRHAEAFTLFTAMNTGHDGCLTFGTKIPFVDGIEEIGSFVDGIIKKGGVRREGEWEVADVEGREINSLNDSGKMQREKVVGARRRPYSGKVRHIRLASGSEITVTPNHPFYGFGGGVRQVPAENLEEAMFVATPARLYCSAGACRPEVEYWSGLLHGDGHILDSKRVREKNGKCYECNEGRISLFTEDESIVPQFSAFMKREFDDAHVGVRAASPEKNCFEVRVSGIGRARQAQQMFAIPAGSRSNAKMSNSHFCSSVNEFVAGFFDAEGYVDLENNAVVFTCGNEQYIDFVRYALLTEGIVSRKYESRTANSRWFRVYVYGIENARKFYSAFPLKYPEKIKKLELMLSGKAKANTNVDVVPCNAVIREKIAEAKKAGISERAIARKADISQALLRFFRLGERMPSRDSVKKLAHAFEAIGINADALGQLAESEIFWDRITHIHEFDYSGFVYDLTVSEKEMSGLKPHNFVAESVIVGNSLGTVHANSPQETVVRVTSPPMNVPEVMLSGLDFIIIEHRLHDKKKGTIRRVTEIAEVEGALQGKISTQTVYEWDAATDTMKRGTAPVSYLNELMKRTGMGKKQIDAELAAREKFLKNLVNNNVHSMGEVSLACQAFLGERGKQNAK